MQNLLVVATIGFEIGLSIERLAVQLTTTRHHVAACFDSPRDQGLSALLMGTAPAGGSDKPR